MKQKTIEGFPMFLNPDDGGISGALARKGLREPCFMWLLRKEAKGDLAIDVGGNIGYTTLSLCKNMNRVVAIEPDKRSRKLLSKNIELNGYTDKTTIYDFAISNKSGNQTIYLSDRPNLTTLCKPIRGNHTTKTIRTKTIDELDLNPEFIKMDIEGYEVEALQGASNTLQRVKSCKILIEVHPMFYTKDRNFKKVLENIVGFGFNVKYVISAAVIQPDLFKEHRYEPMPKAPQNRRAIYDCISNKHAIDWCSRVIKQKCPNGKTSPKIIRAILLEKA